MGAKLETYFDETAADRICQWFEQIIVSPELGKPCPLQPWLRDILRHVYGTKHKDGTRVVRTLYLEIPKKNSKSYILSGLTLFHLCADGERSAEVYAVAGDRAQAGIVFDASKKMAAASPRLAKVIEPYRNTLIAPKTGSKLSATSAEAETKEGIKASCIAFDELHVQPDRRLWDTLRGSGLSRRQPLTIVATTAGDSRTSIAWEVHDYAKRVADGKVIDPSFYPVIYGADEGDDPHDPETWRKANPSYGVTFQHEDFKTLYEEAKAAGPQRFQSWKRYHLNIWATSVTAWLPMDKWEQCGEQIVSAESLIGQTAYPGLDVASTTDLTACVLWFPQADGTYQLLAYHWMPRARVQDAEQRDRVPYRQWAAQGYIELTEGSAIDHRLIKKRILELHEKYPFADQRIRLDDYNAWQLIAELEGDGLEPVPVSMKSRGMSAPSKELLRLVTEGKLHHGGNPLLAWQASQAEVAEDNDGNIRPVKGKGEARKRIDGIVAAVIGLSGAMLSNSTPAVTESVYDSRGIFIL